MTVDQAVASWRLWLTLNPDAGSHQRYYAAGVIDGLKFSQGGIPEWTVWVQQVEPPRKD